MTYLLLGFLIISTGIGLAVEWSIIVDEQIPRKTWLVSLVAGWVSGAAIYLISRSFFPEAESMSRGFALLAGLTATDIHAWAWIAYVRMTDPW